MSKLYVIIIILRSSQKWFGQHINKSLKHIYIKTQTVLIEKHHFCCFNKCANSIYILLDVQPYRIVHTWWSNTSTMDQRTARFDEFKTTRTHSDVHTFVSNKSLVLLNATCSIINNQNNRSLLTSSLPILPVSIRRCAKVVQDRQEDAKMYMRFQCRILPR